VESPTNNKSANQEWNEKGGIENNRLGEKWHQPKYKKRTGEKDTKEII